MNTEQPAKKTFKEMLADALRELPPRKKASKEDSAKVALEVERLKLEVAKSELAREQKRAAEQRAKVLAEQENERIDRSKAAPLLRAAEQLENETQLIRQQLSKFPKTPNQKDI